MKRAARKTLEQVAAVFRDAFDYNPGHSDLDNEQPISIFVKLGDWRALNMAIGNERWIPVDERLPDDDITVMIALLGGDEDVWLGWHDAEGWRSVDATPLGDGVTHWKPMIEGPTK